MKRHGGDVLQDKPARPRSNSARIPGPLPKRYTRTLSVFLCVVALVFVWGVTLSAGTGGIQGVTKAPPPRHRYPLIQDSPPEGYDLPPLYANYRRYEDRVSRTNRQHGPETKKYLYAANHPWNAGWGNALQDMVFVALLAQQAGRGFVWDDYTWNPDGSKYSMYNGKLIPSTIPISTMLSGHMLGLDESGASNTTLPISRRIYEEVCPPNAKKVINRTQVKRLLDENADLELNITSESLDFSASGEETLKAWLALLNHLDIVDEQCVEIADEPVFDIWLLGSTRMHDIWERLANSPILNHWVWSPLIHRAFERNRGLFPSRRRIAEIDRSTGFLSRLWRNIVRTNMHTDAPITSVYDRGMNEMTEDVDNADVPSRYSEDTTPLPILVLHIRRGDFATHCKALKDWNSTFTGFNSFPQFADRDAFGSVTPGVEMSEEAVDIEAQKARDEAYERHCFPDIVRVVSRVREVVAEYNDWRVEEGRRDELEGLKGWWRRLGLRSMDRGIDARAFVSDWAVHEQPVDEGMSASDNSTSSEVVERRVDKRLPIRPYPPTRRIPANIQNVRDRLRGIYIMTNGDREWLEELKLALRKDVANWPFDWAWEEVASSRDLDLGWEDKPVAQALDTYIAQRAEVFIGNGFSSLTGNVVMLRMKAGLDPVQTRFW